MRSKGPSTDCSGTKDSCFNLHPLRVMASAQDLSPVASNCDNVSIKEKKKD